MLSRYGEGLADWLRGGGEVNEPVVIELKGEVAPSWNKGTAHKHWTAYAVIKKAAWWVVRSALTGEEEMFTVPVDIEVVAYYLEDDIDSDNIMAKVYIDALKDKLIKDDDMRYVRRVTTEARAGAPKVVITITPAQGL